MIIDTLYILPDDDFWFFNYAIDVTNYIEGDGNPICLKLGEEELGEEDSVLVVIASKENVIYSPPKLIWTEESSPRPAILRYYITLFLLIIFLASIISIVKKRIENP
ncbi:MAG: hypothetical protein ACFFD2_23735 [Promethearchaeota archaeon]